MKAWRPNDPESLNERITSCRTFKGFSKRELARVCGVSHQGLERMLVGKSDCNLEILRKLPRALEEKETTLFVGVNFGQQKNSKNQIIIDLYHDYLVNLQRIEHLDEARNHLLQEQTQLYLEVDELKKEVQQKEDMVESLRKNLQETEVENMKLRRDMISMFNQIRNQFVPPQ